MFRKLLTFEEAKRAIEANFRAVDLGMEEAVLLEAYNRVVGLDVISSIDLPSFDTSIINGYAVNASDTLGAEEEHPVELRIIGCTGSGESSKLKLGRGEAVEIAINAVIPEGANAVISIDDCGREDDNLQVYAAVSSNTNLQRMGSDVKKGSIALHKGQVLGASEIGILAALGLKQVKVQKIPVVAVVSVGDNVSELSKALAAGKTYDINAYSLCTAVLDCGGKPLYLGVVSESKDAVSRILRIAVDSADMVIACSDGPSISEFAELIGKPGIIVNGVAIKPGKSVAMAYVGEKPLFLLPNNPIAALLTYNLFARSIVQRLAGRPIWALRTVVAFAGSKMFSAKGSRKFVMVKLEFDRTCRLIAEPIKADGPVSALAETYGFVEIGENEQFVATDKEVVVTLLRGLAYRV
jgi:molybdopterin biosynthesis enzyme